MDKGAFLCSWSGGKDSCYAFMQAVRLQYTPKVLLSVLNEEGNISRSHGIPANILQAQSNALGIPIQLISSSWDSYEKNFTNALQKLKKEYDLEYAVFGDIDLQAHRDWEEKVCNNAGLKAILPIWQQQRKALVLEMLHNNVETIIVSCNEIMGEKFLGQALTPALIDELEFMGIDTCGENGEFHTLVLSCPLFNKRINIEIVKTIQHQQYWFCDLRLLN